MRSKLSAAAGAIALAAAVAVPATPAQADSFRDDQWYLKTLKVAQAHAITKGAGVTVAVVDSGTYPHPDLKKNLLPGIDESDGTKNGEADNDGHGTQMSSIIAAHGRGKDGVLGIAPDAKLLPVKVGERSGEFSSDEATNGIEWAAHHGAKVVNVSLGLGSNLDLEDAVTAAIENNDVVIVASIGNTGQAFSASDPATIDGVLAVGAVDRNLNHADFSILDRRVQICAPGVDITAAQPKDKYVDDDGTSPATAIVSGAAALVRAKFPQLSAKEVIHRLTATADEIGPPGRDKECGYGVLNIMKALTANVPPLDGGQASASATTTPATNPSAPDTTTPAVAPTTAVSQAENTKSNKNNAPVIIGAVLFGLILVGGLVFMTQRRRRNF